MRIPASIHESPALHELPVLRSLAVTVLEEDQQSVALDTHFHHHEAGGGREVASGRRRRSCGRCRGWLDREIAGARLADGFRCAPGPDSLGTTLLAT
jgi:hypothetical protein